MVRLMQVTRENLGEVLALEVNEQQKRYVSTTAESISQAYVYAETAFPFAVYDDDTAVGFIMMGYYEAKGYYTLWKLLIDRRYQHRGFGREALRLGIEYMKERFGVRELYTGVTPGNTAAKRLYESMGFTDTGLVEYDMEEMRLEC